MHSYRLRCTRMHRFSVPTRLSRTRKHVRYGRYRFSFFNVVTKTGIDRIVSRMSNFRRKSSKIHETHFSYPYENDGDDEKFVPLLDRGYLCKFIFLLASCSQRNGSRAEICFSY